MSADNGVFIVDIPHGYAVIEATMQQMPSMIRNYMSSGLDYSGRKILCFGGNNAWSQAESPARHVLSRIQISEHGIVDFRNPARDYKPEFHPSGDKHANV